MSDFDAAVVGAGPNGLAAAIELARAGRKTLLIEAADQVGGGTRTEASTLPGFKHDVCSAIHPAAIASPYFNEIDLEIDWVHSPISFTHPLDGGRVAALHRSVTETAAGIGEDGSAYAAMMEPLVENIEEMVGSALGPLRLIPEHKAAFARLALIGGMPAALLAKRFSTEEGKALIAGISAHAIAPFHAPATAAVGIMLGAIGHSHGWPMARGGSQAIAGALLARFVELGGEVEVGRTVDTTDELPAELVFLDVMPPAALAMTRGRISGGNALRLSRWKPGPGVFKIDWALAGPIPWRSRELARAGTVHLSGSAARVARVARSVNEGRIPDRPFVLLVQPSLIDTTRAPDGRHTAWAYCHVPHGCAADMRAAIEAEVERAAPGFRDLVLGSATHDARQMEAHDENYVGGDINGGAQDGLQLFFRPVPRLDPWSTPLPGVYLCSSSTPPGGGAHGMCGHLAARSALRREFGGARGRLAP